MKFSISKPPGADSGLEDVCAWLYELSELLEVVLANLGEENLNSSMKKYLSEGKKQDGNI